MPNRAPSDFAKLWITLVTESLTSFRSSIGVEKIIQVLDGGYCGLQGRHR